MRYAHITPFEVCNGEGIGISLFVQGCHFHCTNCFNQETWSFDGGKEWNEEIENKFLELASKDYIKRISILGGEPLASENVDGVYELIMKIKDVLPNKTMWLYTGQKWETAYSSDKTRRILEQCDVVIDGRYVDELKDLTLLWRGSSNQRVINVCESLKKNEVVLYNS